MKTRMTMTLRLLSEEQERDADPEGTEINLRAGRIVGLGARDRIDIACEDIEDLAIDPRRARGSAAARRPLPRTHS